MQTKASVYEMSKQMNASKRTERFKGVYLLKTGSLYSAIPGISLA